MGLPDCRVLSSLQEVGHVSALEEMWRASGVLLPSNPLLSVVCFCSLFFAGIPIANCGSSELPSAFFFVGGWPRLGFGGLWRASRVSSPSDAVLSLVCFRLISFADVGIGTDPSSGLVTAPKQVERWLMV